MIPEERQFNCKISTEGKETVFKLADGREFRIEANSGSEALEAFKEWKKTLPAEPTEPTPDA